MEAKFWLERWATNNIGFHKSEANPALVKYFSRLALAPRSRVFLPLCGKTLDAGWLLTQGHKIVGAELSELAITQLFEHLELTPRISETGKLKHFAANDIDMFVGDFFDLTVPQLGQVDAIYDRAAIVALPEPMRHQYTAHLQRITDSAPQLLVSLEYDQAKIDGPPFSVSGAEIKRHYDKEYFLEQLSCVATEGGVKGIPATESVWLLTKRASV